MTPKSPGSGRPLLDIEVPAVVVCDPTEQLTCFWSLPRSFIEVGQCVGATKVMIERALGPLPSFAEQPHRVLQLSLIGECARGHDATFDDDGRGRRRLTDFLPQLLDVGIVANRTMSIGQNGILVG